MSQHTQKCEVNAIFKQNYALEIFTAFKMVYSCSFSLVENLDYLDFLQKMFYNINYRSRCHKRVLA